MNQPVSEIPSTSGVRCDAPVISVVIPSDRTGSSLNYCLLALSQQTLATTAFEIVLILDGVAMDAGIMTAARSLPIRICSLPTTLGRSCARNVGIQYAKGAVIVSLDGDMVASPLLLSQYFLQHQQGDFVCVGVRTFSEVTEDWQPDYEHIFDSLACRDVNRPDYRDTFYRQTDFLKTAAEPFWAFSTCNCSYPRDLANRVGRFDENIRGWGLEDQEFGYRLWKSREIDFVHLSDTAAIHIEHERDRQRERTSWRENCEYLKHKHGSVFSNPTRSIRLANSRIAPMLHQIRKNDA